ncbi:MAG: hypothetical protein K8S23_08380, partial [Candidatus Cloacimonetes bacterium]|nr:hypothetical protein [Candidatus Cloacimonadota bacterium]
MKKIVFVIVLLVCFMSIYAENVLEGTVDIDGNSILPFIENYDSMDLLPKRSIRANSSILTEVNYDFSAARVTSRISENMEFNYLHIDGFAKMDIVGAPALPAHNEIIAIPRGATGEVVILDASYKEFDGYMIHPALMPARDTEGAPEPDFTINKTLYNTDKFFPENIVEILDIGLSRGTPLLKTQIRPVQFNPVTKKIRVYSNINFRIETSGGAGSFDYISEENSLQYSNLLKLNVLNSSIIPNGIPYANYDTRTGEKNYIIITHSQYLTYANQLANWKRQMGYSVEVVSQSSWTAAQVKTQISTRYNSWTPKPDYFVIIGDHTGSYAVPGEIHQDPYDGDNFATDLYFACMDGSTDWHPDMAHGRISVSSTTEASTIVNKIITYEKNPPTSSTFYSNMLSCAQYQDDDNNGYADRRFCHTSEDIRDYLTVDQNYSSTRIYYTSSSASVTGLRYNDGYYSNSQLLPSALRSTSFDWNGGSSDITSAINAGKFLVFHRDHGYSGGSGWAHPYYTTTSMNSLSNGNELPVIFSMNCHTGEFQLSNCFAEKFLRMSNKGAVGVVGAAYYSLSGYNDALSEGMIDAIWADPGIHPNFGSGGTGSSYEIGVGNEIYTMGDVVNQGLYAMEQNWGGSTSNEKYEYELFHWFGDPAMKIWTSNPNNNVITANHANEISEGSTSFAITSSNCSDGLATLYFDGELIGSTTLSGGSGTISCSAITNAASIAIITISKHNYKPYTSNITVGSGSGSGTTVQIGSGTLTDQHIPIEAYYGYTYSQSIYLQSEINVANSQIEKISYYWNGNSSWTDAVKVYLGHTSKTSFSGTSDWVSLSSLTQVFDGNLGVSSSAGWVEITLDQPFSYNNSNNLIVAVDENTSSYHGSGDEFHCSSVSGNRSIYFYSDSTNPNPSSPPTGGNYSGTRASVPNIKLVFADGTTTSPSFAFSPSSLSYGNVQVGNSSTLQFTISNS